MAIKKSLFIIIVVQFFNCAGTNYKKLSIENPAKLVAVQDSLLLVSGDNQRIKDALVTASHIVTKIRDFALEISKQDNSHFVATVGRVEVYPNGAAIIPGQVSMILDLRASNAQSRDRFLSSLQAACSEIGHRESCVIGMDPISAANVAPMASSLRTHLANSAEELGLSHISIASGAGHDMAHMSRIAPAAMIFIPCKDGLSHCPEEFATPEAIARGSAVLTHTVLTLAGRDI